MPDADPLRIVYLGTGSFAVPALEALVRSRHDVAALVTQPDRVARGGRRHANEAKQAAERLGVAVLQPERINDDAASAELADLDADLTVTASYGQYLGRRVREITPHGAINLHGSILPKYRGAAPVQWAVWNREAESGVSVFQIGKGMDTGPVFHFARCPVEPTDTSADLFARLAALSADACLEVVDAIADRSAVAIPQDESQATHARKLTKADGEIDWSQPAERVRGQVLATQPWPKASTTFGGRRLIVLGVTPREGRGEPGTVLATDNELIIACGVEAVRIDRVQVEGKAAMDAAALLNGYDIAAGQMFGPRGAA